MSGATRRANAEIQDKVGRSVPAHPPIRHAVKSVNGPVGQVGDNPRGVLEIQRETPLRRSNGQRMRH